MEVDFDNTRVDSVEETEVDVDEETEIDVDEEGEWFWYQTSYFDQNTEDWVFDKPRQSKVKVRRIQPFIQKRLQNRKRVVEHVLNPKTRSMERISYFKEQTPEEAQKETDDTWDYAIVDFVGFKNMRTKKIIECTRANKLKLITDPVFNRFIARCFRILDGSEKRQKEEAEKTYRLGSMG